MFGEVPLCNDPGSVSPPLFCACPPLSPATREILISYMAKSLRLSVPASLKIAADDVVEGCYHRLRFESASGVSTIYLAPDQRFFARQLFDLELDPTPAIKASDSEVERLLLADPSPSLGPVDAPVTIVEFSDFQGPYCRALQKQLDSLPSGVLPHLRIVYKYFPLSQHTWARQAATFSACAARQSKDAFWTLQEAFFREQDSLMPATIEQFGIVTLKTLPVDVAELKACTTNHSADAVVDRDLVLARKLTITSTPTVFLNGERIPPTELSADLLTERIRRSLSDSPAGATTRAQPVLQEPAR